jgi:DNA end-binding protein Ku
VARPIWTGSISFGLVSVPVALHSATEDHTIPFRQLERDTDDRVRNKRVNERTGEEVDYADVVKGYEVRRGEYVTVEPEELAEIAPGRSRSLGIDTFVDLAEIDPMRFGRSYWLAPDGDDVRAYQLLRRALADTDRAGIALFVLRGKEHLTAVRARERLLTLQLLHFADEIRDPADVLGDLPAAGRAKKDELRMAVDLVESMSSRWDPGQYRDTYRDRVAKLVRDKEAGREPEPAAEPDEPGDVVDLADALRRSIEPRRGDRKKSAKTTKSRTSGRAKTAGKSGTARKTKRRKAS